MTTDVYEVTDHDILLAFFKDGAPVRRLAELGKDHGDLIWHGEMNNHPDQNDLLLIQNNDGEDLEYIVVQRLYHADDNKAILIVHTPHYEEGTQS